MEFDFYAPVRIAVRAFEVLEGDPRARREEVEEFVVPASKFQLLEEAVFLHLRETARS